MLGYPLFQHCCLWGSSWCRLFLLPLLEFIRLFVSLVLSASCPLSVSRPRISLFPQFFIFWLSFIHNGVSIKVPSPFSCKAIIWEREKNVFIPSVWTWVARWATEGGLRMWRLEAAGGQFIAPSLSSPRPLWDVTWNDPYLNNILCANFTSLLFAGLTLFLSCSSPTCELSEGAYSLLPFHVARFPKHDLLTLLRLPVRSDFLIIPQPLSLFFSFCVCVLFSLFLRCLSLSPVVLPTLSLFVCLFSLSLWIVRVLYNHLIVWTKSITF